MTKQQLPTLSKLEQSLLQLALDASRADGEGVSTARLRAQNRAHIPIFDKLETRGRLRRAGERYVVAASVLPFLESEASKALLARLDAIYAVAQQHYLEVQADPMLVSTICAATALSLDEASDSLEVMTDVPVWWSGRSSDLRSEGATVTVAEGVLRHDSFTELAIEVNSWEPHPSPADEMQVILDATSAWSEEPDVSTPPPDEPRVLPELQAKSVLKVAGELESFRIKPNDYYDDPEPRAFFDDALNGLLKTVRVYCDANGWKRLSAVINELLPIQNDALENLELIQSYIAPELRRLALVPTATTFPGAVKALHQLPAWPALRACLARLDFYDIKTVVGLAGMNLSALSHLDDDTGASVAKGRLLSAIDGLQGSLTTQASGRFLTILVEEILRRSETSWDDLDEYLSRLGWTFVDGRVVPIDVLDPQTLEDTPSVCREDLLKAAQRFRDGDLTGAVTAACGAVDTATSQVYLELSLGDPQDASFQERCSRAVKARGALPEVYAQLHALGWDEADVRQFQQNLRSALNSGANVMQTLRRKMGDVHGSKPILRSLAFDCLRWAELLVGALVARPDAQRI